jgi:hypothetical protein
MDQTGADTNHIGICSASEASCSEVKNNHGPNEIDYFILQKLERRGLTPNEEADKERLLKRVSLILPVFRQIFQPWIVFFRYRS